MSKAVLIMDMPRSCAECKFLDNNYDYPMCILTGETRGYTFRTYENKMDRCPLKPVTEVEESNMKVFDEFKMKNKDELANWLDKYGAYDNAPWTKWFDDNYCSKCEAEVVYIPAFDREGKCSWCELHDKCKYFKDMNDVPDNKQIIKMWLESEK